jgi:glycosyltransferase involved in cell wall biosynthesis
MSTIGIDIRNLGKKRTGDETVFFNLTKNLSKIDNYNEYKLFTDIIDKKTLNDMKNNLEINDKPNFQIISSKTANKFTWNFWTIQKYLRKNPVDIYLTQYITPFFVPKSTKIITIIHDISFNFFPQFIKWSDLFFLKLLIPISLRRADKIIGVSKFTHDEIIKYYKIRPEKVSWVHNAVSEDFLKQDTSDEKKELVKKKYNLPEKYILYLGTLQPRKNITTLIEAFNLAKDKLNNTKLVIAGGKGHNFDKNIDRYVEEYNLEKNVIMPGFIDEEDKTALMKSAQVFVFPSLYEGFGIPILEAMSVGIPIVISDIPPHREIAGEAALFFDPKSPTDLSEKLLKVITGDALKTTLTEKAKADLSRFSWEKTAENFIKIIDNLLIDK